MISEQQVRGLLESGFSAEFELFEVARSPDPWLSESFELVKLAEEMHWEAWGYEEKGGSEGWFEVPGLRSSSYWLASAQQFVSGSISSRLQ